MNTSDAEDVLAGIKKKGKKTYCEKRKYTTKDSFDEDEEVKFYYQAVRLPYVNVNK